MQRQSVQELPEESMPTPMHYYRPLSSLSSKQCEALALHPIQLQGQLSSPKEDNVKAVLLHGKRSVAWVCLVQGQWLLVASSERTASVLSPSLWIAP